MAEITTWFRCPACGQHAPIERLQEEGPFELTEHTRQIMGKRKLTEEEREQRRGLRLGRGSGPGRIVYDPVELSDELKGLFAQRLKELG